MLRKAMLMKVTQTAKWDLIKPKRFFTSQETINITTWTRVASAGRSARSKRHFSPSPLTASEPLLLPVRTVPAFSRTVFKPSVQFSSVAHSCPTLCYPMNRSTSGLPVHQQLLGFTQTHVHRVGDAIQPSIVENN